MANPLEKTAAQPTTFETAKRNFDAITKKFDTRRPTLDEFSVEKGGPYPAAEVASDRAWITRKKKQIFIQGARGDNAEMEERRLYAEYVFMEMVDSGELFDNDMVEVMPSSEFDDLANGADAVVTFCDDDGNVEFAFSVDVKAALTAESENVEKVERLVREKIYSGVGSSVKYFIHENVETGEVSRRAMAVPNFVIWVEPETIQSLMLALAKKEKDKTAEDEKLISRETKKLYQSMMAQCEKALKILAGVNEKNGLQSDPKIAKTRLPYQDLIEKIREYVGR